MGEDANNFNDEVVTSILDACTKSAPRGSRQFYKPFWNPNIEKEVDTRNTARDVLEETPGPTNRTEYNKACAKVKLTVKSSKKEKWEKTTADLNLDHEGNKAWTLLKNLSGDKRSSNPKPMEHNGATLATDQKKAEHMNKFFASVSRAAELTDQDREKLKELKSDEKSPKPAISLFSTPFSKNELRQAFSKLKLKKAPGPDKIHSEMLLKLGPVGKDVLLRLINLSWEKENYPKFGKMHTWCQY